MVAALVGRGGPQQLTVGVSLGDCPKKLLTPAGYLHAWVLGSAEFWGCLGWQGYLVVNGVFPGPALG